MRCERPQASTLKEAMFYKKAGRQEVVCNLCSHRCRIGESKRGICAIRENRGGVLYSLVYGRLVSRAVDPIEKKPFFHFLPGSGAYSVATVGCNFTCRHCQNADIAQLPRDARRIIGEEVSPEAVVRDALRRNCSSIAYTYTEPTIFFEYAYETAVLAHDRGIRNVFVSNGYITEEATLLIAPYLDGINIDLKGSEAFYKKTCGAHLQPVVETLRRMHDLGIWIEVTTLVIPGLNDGDEDLGPLARIIAGVSPDIPWHISAFHPAYRLLDRPSTSPETIERAREIGSKAGLSYVYAGNLPGRGGEETSCRQCGQLLIRRIGYTITENAAPDGTCPYCGAAIPGVWPRKTGPAPV